MKVICIKRGSGYQFHNNNEISDENSLTVGKVYDAGRVFFDPLLERWEKNHDIIVVNEYGVLTWYGRSILIPLDEWREKQLSKMGI